MRKDIFSVFDIVCTLKVVEERRFIMNMTQSLIRIDSDFLLNSILKNMSTIVLTHAEQ